MSRNNRPERLFRKPQHGVVGFFHNPTRFMRYKILKAKGRQERKLNSEQALLRIRLALTNQDQNALPLVIAAVQQLNIKDGMQLYETRHHYTHHRNSADDESVITEKELRLLLQTRFVHKFAEKHLRNDEFKDAKDIFGQVTATPQDTLRQFHPAMISAVYGAIFLGVHPKVKAAIGSDFNPHEVFATVHRILANQERIQNQHRP